jgi:thiamine-monophosphate kinase
MVVKGIGDDCAILQPPPAHQLLVTTDFSLEGIHFRREWHPPESIGHRCLTRGLSDIAAMAGAPVAIFISLALPADLPQSWVNRFFKGLFNLADQHGVPVAGGDTAQSPSGVLADIIVVGSVPREAALLRAGAKAGDRIYVTGKLGLGGATVRRMYAGEHIRPASAKAYFYPQPRLAVALKLRGIASALIDISDGLSTDLSHICEESGVGAVVDSSAVPVAKSATLTDALHGGDDYELLFTSSKRVPQRIFGVPITSVGEIRQGSRLWIRDAKGQKQPLDRRGWEHFSGRE